MNVDISPALMERVDAGVEWANENIPDWREYVDPKKLNMLFDKECFLGQYWQAKYGPMASFYEALKIHFSGDWARTDALGFSTYIGGYPELTAAWRRKFVELGMLTNAKEAQG